MIADSKVLADARAAQGAAVSGSLCEGWPVGNQGPRLHGRIFVSIDYEQVHIIWVPFLDVSDSQS